MPHNTDDLRIREMKELAPPSHTMREHPCTPEVSSIVYESRQAIHRILHGMDDRLVVVIGPCSIHDPVAALDYAKRLMAAGVPVELHVYPGAPHAFMQVTTAAVTKTYSRDAMRALASGLGVPLR